MRCQSGLGSAGPRLMLVIASAGAYSAAPITAPGPTPTPSIASPSTAPDAAPRAAPQISASSIRPERLRLRRSGSPMIGSIAAFQRSPRGTTWSYSSRPLISYDPRDGAKGRGGQLGAGEDRHRRGVAAGAGVRGPHDDRPRRVRGRDDPVRSDGRRPRPWARARVTHRPGPRRTGRGWLEASALVDGIDAAACLLARHHIRTSVFPGAVGLAAAGALLSGWLARQLDPAPPPQSGQPGQ